VVTPGGGEEATGWFASMVNSGTELATAVTAFGAIPAVSGALASTNLSVSALEDIPSYELPPATETVLGGVKVDNSTITIDDTDVISSVLPTASDTLLGGVKVDNSTITSDGTGVITGNSQYELPPATDTVFGEVKVDNSTSTVDATNVISSVLPTATGTVLLGVKVDNNTITIEGIGVIKGQTRSGMPRLIQTPFAFAAAPVPAAACTLYPAMAKSHRPPPASSAASSL